jgi:hypothetical protein
LEPKLIDRMFEGLNFWNEILIKEYSFQNEDQQTILYEKIAGAIPQVKLYFSILIHFSFQNIWIH